MKRTSAFLFLMLLLTGPAGADDAAVSHGGEPTSLSVPADDQATLDWDLLGEFDYGEEGRLLVGSGLSYATSPGFAVGGSYAMAVRPNLGRRDVDPARYTIFMRWRF